MDEERDKDKERDSHYEMCSFKNLFEAEGSNSTRSNDEKIESEKLLNNHVVQPNSTDFRNNVDPYKELVDDRFSAIRLHKYFYGNIDTAQKNGKEISNKMNSQLKNCQFYESIFESKNNNCNISNNNNSNRNSNSNSSNKSRMFYSPKAVHPVISTERNKLHSLNDNSAIRK